MRTEDNDPRLWLSAFPWPSSQGHKYDRGHAAMLSGPAGATGAIRLAARGALRIGAGLVTVLSPPDAMAEHAARLDAIMLREVEDAEGLADVVRAEPRFSALCIGPGFGRGRAKKVLPALIALGRPMVIDADALHALPEDRRLGGGDLCRVLTPHEGEFAVVFPDIGLADRGEAAVRAAGRTGAIVVLKGSETVIAAPDGRSARNPPASPFLASAGTGDVLSGLVAGLLAQDMPAFESACAAVWLHAACANSIGPGLISEDLSETLPDQLAVLYAMRPEG